MDTPEKRYHYFFDGRRVPYSEWNSVQDIVKVIKENNFIPETEIFKLAFGYDRNNSGESNKKYTDMLRRGLSKKLYYRVQLDKAPKFPNNKSKWYYFIPD